MYTGLQIFGLDLDGVFSDGGGGYKLSKTDDIATGRIMVYGSQDYLFGESNCQMKKQIVCLDMVYLKSFYMVLLKVVGKLFHFFLCHHL